MDQEGFRAFYESTARSLWGYLESLSGNAALAEDLMQEAYLKFINARLPDNVGEAHRKHYLFRIATNLVRDHYRHSRVTPETTGDMPDHEPSVPDASGAVASRQLV